MNSANVPGSRGNTAWEEAADRSGGEVIGAAKLR